MSDLHGCYDEYRTMLEKINLNCNDKLYILGDVIDRGEGGIKILLDMMTRPNIIPLRGNHELMALPVLTKLNAEENLDHTTMKLWQEWMVNGGNATKKDFILQNYSKRKRILDYLETFSLYEIIKLEEKEFVLVHAGLSNFSQDKKLSDYSTEDIICGRCNYQKAYFDDKILVTGHTPTFTIDKNYHGRIYSKNNHIAIDCGAIYGYTLGCICLNTLEEFYV